MCRCAERRRQIAAAVNAYVKGYRAQAGSLMRMAGASLREDAAGMVRRTANLGYRVQAEKPR